MKVPAPNASEIWDGPAVPNNASRPPAAVFCEKGPWMGSKVNANREARLREPRHSKRAPNHPCFPP